MIRKEMVNENYLPIKYNLINASHPDLTTITENCVPDEGYCDSYMDVDTSSITEMDMTY